MKVIIVGAHGEAKELINRISSGWSISVVDLDQEKERMEKRINEINRLITGINGKLSNDNFVKRAPEQVVEKERSNLKKLTEEFDKVTANLEMLQ